MANDTEAPPHALRELADEAPRAVTERVDMAADAEQVGLVRSELQRRVRNMLAIIRSVFDRTVAAGGSIEDIGQHFTGRLEALGRYQLARSHHPGGGVDLEGIVRDELQTAQAAGDPRVIVSGPDVRLSDEAADLVGLAVHELVTNSIKFGVLNSTTNRPRLKIEWLTRQDKLELRWQETGIPIVASAPIRRGFGTEFIEEALAYQLGAQVARNISAGKLSWIIVFPSRTTIVM